jgi:hypothetical protein
VTEAQLKLIETERQPRLTEKEANYLRIIAEIKEYQETSVWPPATSTQPKISATPARELTVDEIADELVKQLEGR